MKLNAFFEDREAVSPVIGVILMVAITVILAAVIGTFVLGLGDQVGDTAPNANWDTDTVEDYDNSNDVVIFTHTGGDQVDPATLSVSGDWANEIGNVTDEGSVNTNEIDEPLSAGDEIVVQVEGTEGSINLVWTSGDRSSILRTAEFDFN